MPPLVRAGLSAALVATAAIGSDHPARVSHRSGGPRAPASAPSLTAQCPKGTLPDDQVCVPVPLAPASDDPRDSTVGAPRAGLLERIARRPDRPPEYARYRLPVAPVEPATEIGSGVRLAAAKGTTVSLVALEHQEGDAIVLHAGSSDAGVVAKNAVVTVHSVREASGLREYLALYSGFERLSPEVVPGAKLADGAALGVVGAEPGERPALVYELRRGRAGVSARTLTLFELAGDAKAVACDPRNVLPLAAK